MHQNTKTEICKLRNNIDDIDSTILSLLQERLKCAKEIGRLKESENREKWDPLREQEILNHLLTKNKKIFPEDVLTSIFTEIIATCRRLQ